MSEEQVKADAQNEEEAVVVETEDFKVMAAACAENLDAACAKLSIGDSLECVFAESGEKITIKKTVIEEIPYLRAYFRSELTEEESGVETGLFKPPAKNDEGRFILPPELDGLKYLKPILSYVESGQPLDLLAKLSTTFCDVHQMLMLFDFLSIDKPAVDGDLDSIRQRTTDIMDYDEDDDYHVARYGRLEARNAAGEFCIGLALGAYNNSVNSERERQKIYERMLFILSHPRTFRPRLRHHAKAISDKILAPWITAKEKGILEQQFSGRPLSDDDDEEKEDSDTDRDLSDGPADDDDYYHSHNYDSHNYGSRYYGSHYYDADFD